MTIKLVPRDLTPVKLEMSEYAGMKLLSAIRRVDMEMPSSETAYVLNWLGSALEKWGIHPQVMTEKTPDYMFRRNI